MTCNDFLERHTEWLDGELDSAAARRVMAHASRCESCARYDRVVRRGTDLVRNIVPPVEVSDDFGARVRHRLYHERDAMARRRSMLPSVYAAAAAVVLVSAGAGAYAVIEGRTPVVEGKVVVVDAPRERVTPILENSRAVDQAPTLALASVQRDAPARRSAPPVQDPKASPADGAEVEETWPVYSRGAVAVAFPAARNDGVTRTADFRPVGSRAPVTPLLIRY